MRYITKYPLTCFLIIHFIVWSVVPLLRQSLPMDSLEAILWGMYCDWGTNKHPPLSGWLAYMFYDFGGGSFYAIYLLSQVCVLLGLIYIYRLARCLFDKEKAIVSVLLLEGVIYYGYSSVEFNVNVVSLALWPITVYYFYKALQTERLTYWMLSGLFAGLNILNKYVCAVLLLSMLIYMLVSRFARCKFKTVGPYVAALTAIIVVAPHIYWLWQHDFFVFDYFLGREDSRFTNQFPLLARIFFPLRFLFSQLMFGLGAILLYWWSTYKADVDAKKQTFSNRMFVAVLGGGPCLLMLLISLLTGTKLKSMWGFPCLYMLGIALVMFFPKKITTKVLKKLLVGTYVLMLLVAGTLLGVYAFNTDDKVHFNAKEFAYIAEDTWYEQVKNKPLKYVVGDIWLAGNAALFAPEQPKPVIWGDIHKNPWLDKDDFYQAGALILAETEDEYAFVTQRLNNVSVAQSMKVTMYNLSGQAINKTIYFGFYNL